MSTVKTFKVAGVSKGTDGYKVRFATDMSRVKILCKHFTDVQLVELPEAMQKPAIATFLKTSELYANELYREAIDSADAKYNPVATVKVRGAPKKDKTAQPSMDAIKARKPKAAKAEVVAEVAAPEASV